MDMMLDNLKGVAVVALTAYPLTWLGAVQRALNRAPAAKDRLLLIAVFATLSVGGNWTATEVFNKAILNCGLVGPVVGGLIAGPVVGFWSGFIGGLHRLSLGGFTVMANCFALIAAGVLGGIFYCRLRQKRLRFVYSFLAGALASLLDDLFLLTLAEPWILAVTFVKWVGLTSMLVNGVATGLFASIVQNVQTRQHSIGTSYAEKVTEIAQRALPVIKGDLDAGVAQEIVSIIDAAAIASAVAITDGTTVLAFAGAGCESHGAGSRDLALTERFTRSRDEIRAANNKQEIGCHVLNCPHDAVLIAPLYCGNEQIGFLHVYKVQDVVHPPDITLVSGIANLLSLQFQSARLEAQGQLLAQAEFAALRSQVNPHFLFNALSVIKLQIREDPVKAQQTLLALAAFFRRTLEVNRDLILLADEIRCVEFYLTIQQARFGDRLQVEYDIAPECMSIFIPCFIVQPLVENCFNHGFSGSGESLHIKISGRCDQQVLSLCVQDNGCGIPDAVIEAVRQNKTVECMGVGLTNINRRLKSIYGHRYSFHLANQNAGVAVEITIQMEERHENNIDCR